MAVVERGVCACRCRRRRGAPPETLSGTSARQPPNIPEARRCQKSSYMTSDCQLSLLFFARGSQPRPPRLQGGGLL
jgi:hypothetical protein